MSWKYFTEDEMRCKCGCGRCEMDEEFMRLLDKMRGRCGFPFKVTSGFRCPQYNAQVSITGADGPHTTGKAADIALSERRKYFALDELFGLVDTFRGIGIGNDFIHLDTLTPEERPSRPCVWTY
jgi:zinc D-Ala-D-Ala carboxypeptidase